MLKDSSRSIATSASKTNAIYRFFSYGFLFCKYKGIPISHKKRKLKISENQINNPLLVTAIK